MERFVKDKDSRIKESYLKRLESKDANEFLSEKEAKEFERDLRKRVGKR